MTRRSRAVPLEALRLALGGCDVAPLMARLDDTSSLHVPGHSGLGGDYHGRDAIVGILQRMSAATDETLRFETDRMPASRASPLRVHGRWTGTRSGHAFSAKVSIDAMLAGHVFRSITIGCADPSAWDAFWGCA